MEEIQKSEMLTESQKWDQSICGEFSTLHVRLFLNDCKQDVYFAEREDPPTHGEFIARILDSRVTVIDAGNGRLLYDCPLMELALQRIRASFLQVLSAAAGKKESNEKETA